MINQKELEIANTSYTNKDFGAVYTEILDTARKISTLWAPQSSNESDPGVVLLKLLAFMADKLNFNVDKNILENFMLSATQESSMRKLCDMMGYYMNYYVSANTYVTFTYKGPELDKEDGEIKYIKFPKFETVVSNEDNSLQYVLWENLTLTSDERSSYALIKEGFLNIFNVGDSDKITLENLDSQNRLYFGETQIAQNGVLVREYNSNDESATFWKAVENLNIQNPGEKCFKFGYDSKEKLPYIEFPKDIASIIGEGLYIRYLVTSGYYGNVGVGNLTKLLSPTSVKVTGGAEDTTISFTGEEGNTSLVIKNNSAATNGSDPESIDSAYINFKKTIGTFETLVTCRDFANHIYNNLYNSTGGHLVSNVQVGDRRTDINHAAKIVTYNNLGQYSKNVSDAYTQLFIHALKGINNPKNDSEYQDSFKLVDENEQSNISELLDAEHNEDSIASISYKYEFPTETEIALIKVLYDIDAKITTAYKVNTTEQLDIKKNVIEALRQKFYSRNIDFGYEIPFESIQNCILQADERIKSVSLKEPELSVKYINGDNEELPLCGTEDNSYTDSPYLKNVAQNVLAGNIALFNYDNRFNYEFGMSQYIDEESNPVGPVLSNLKKFTSLSNITFDQNITEDNPIEVKQNEVIQLIGPKLSSSVGYSAYTNYRTNVDIPAEVDTMLGSGEYLLLVYTNSSQEQIEIIYTEGDIVRSTFDIDHNDFSNDSITKTEKHLYNSGVIAEITTLEPGIDITKVECLGVPVDGAIYKREVVKHTFNSNIKVAWMVSDNVEDNIIYTKFHETSAGSHIYEYVLAENEFFIYSLDGESSYEIFGSGTSLIIKANSSIDISNIFNGACSIPNLVELYEYGIESIATILKSVSFTSDTTFTIQANNVFTLAQGDLVAISKGEEVSFTLQLDNSWKPFSGYTLSYKFATDTTTEGLIPLDGYNIGSGDYNNWRIRSRLDLVAGPNKTQILEPHQSITFTYGEEESEVTISGSNTANEGGRIRLNIGTDLSGGEDMSLELIDPTASFVDESIDSRFPLSALVFTDVDNKSINLVRSDDLCVRDLTTSGISDFAGGYNLLFPEDTTSDSATTLVLLYIEFLKTSTVRTLQLKGFENYNCSGTQITLTNYADGVGIPTISSSTSEAKTYMYILNIPTNCKSISIGITGATVSESIGTMRVGTLKITDGFNNRFELGKLEEENGIAAGDLSTALKDIIDEIDQNGIFYYTCEVDPSKEIEEEELTSPYALFDQNNIASRFAISYIDIPNSAKNIEIVRSSKL